MENSTAEQLVSVMATDCVECGLCAKDCTFLQEKGSPKSIAERWQEQGPDPVLPFECSLCHLCTAVCPKDLDPAALFLALRRELTTMGLGRFPEHRAMKRYEALGRSSWFSWYSLPEGCDTVLFPGCAFSGSRPQVLQQLFTFLQGVIPGLGLVLDCCSKPSHDLGHHQDFEQAFNEMRRILSAQGVRRVIVLCPNCDRVWREYGQTVECVNVYEILAEHWPLTRTTPDPEPLMVHDSCALRFDERIQANVRRLLVNSGCTIRENTAAGRKTFCCGEGGSVPFLRPDLAEQWSEKAVLRFEETPVVTYCAGCVNFLGRKVEASHVLDQLFHSGRVANVRPVRAPRTYWNRYRIKQLFRRRFQGGRRGTRRQLMALL
ncbi:MAG: (Fe-S)-binding protein [Desulfobulbaceae bacterium]|uniref:(Fe-S)-binding protein n=1 Tax=Candidatus Desulfatifera sulfidica TaxID=2841691 RepID=A0A8J6TE46_9BACT|nr:(Fe-S)-binding protein [Candidatus Desulfatifera sulfidica]